MVSEILTQSRTERVFATDDKMIDALPANRSADAFHVGTLPRRPRCREHFLDARSLDLPGETRPGGTLRLARRIDAENVVAITQQVAGNLVKREGLPQLLTGPLGGGMRGDIEMEDTAAVMSQHQKHIEDLEPNRWNRENPTDTMVFTWLTRKVLQL